MENMFANSIPQWARMSGRRNSDSVVVFTPSDGALRTRSEPLPRATTSSQIRPTRNIPGNNDLPDENDAGNSNHQSRSLPTESNMRSRNPWRSSCKAPIRGLLFCNYFVMFYSSLAVIAMGKAIEKDQHWQLAYYICYLLWTVSASISLSVDFQESKSKLINALSHIAWCLGTTYFFASILQIASSVLPNLIPICVNIGLGLSLCFQRVPPGWKHTTLGYMASCFGGQYNEIRVVEELPLVENNELRRIEGQGVEN